MLVFFFFVINALAICFLIFFVSIFRTLRYFENEIDFVEDSQRIKCLSREQEQIVYLLSTQESIVHLSSVPPNQIAHSLQKFKLSTFPMIQRLHAPSTIEPNKSTQVVHVRNILIALFPTTIVAYPQGHSPCTVMPQSPLKGLTIFSHLG